MERVRIGLLGCGTVGSAVVRALRGGDPGLEHLELAGVAVRDPSKPRPAPVSAHDLCTSALALATRDDVDVVVEAIGGVGIARDCVEAALAFGKPVVTANKALVAAHGPALRAQARRRATTLRFEAAVAGSVPVVRTLMHLARADDVERLDAVLNGTCNFVLSEVEAGRTFDEALAAARAAGYAEADATRDVDGLDAADKLAILCQLAWGRAVTTSDVAVGGIAGLDAAAVRRAVLRGRRVRLVAAAADDGTPTVGLRELPERDPLARAVGVDNVVVVTLRRAGRLVLAGPGAGGDATASAIVSDLLDVAPPSVVEDLHRPDAGAFQLGGEALGVADDDGRELVGA